MTLRILHKKINTIIVKRCSSCKEWHPLSTFTFAHNCWDKLSPSCAICKQKYYQKNKVARLEADKARYAKNSEAIKNRVALYRKKYPDRIKAQKKKYNTNNPEKVKARTKKYNANNAKKIKQQKRAHYLNNKERYKQVKATWRLNNPEKAKLMGQRASAKKLSTLKGRLSSNISRGLSRSIAGKKHGLHWEIILGYTYKQLKTRLTYTMPKGYTWKDYKEGKLHVDHIIPQKVFNFEKKEDIDFQKCWALKNLQLLPKTDNLKKGSKIQTPFQPALIFK